MKKTDRHNLASEAKSILEAHSSVLEVIYSFSEGVIYCSPASVSFFGYTSESLCDDIELFFEKISEESKGLMRKSWMADTANNMKYDTIRVEVLDKKNSYLEYEQMRKPFFGDNNALCGFLFELRKCKGNQLNEDAGLPLFIYRNVFDVSPTISFICDVKEGVVVDANKSAHAKLGYLEGDLVGVSFDEVLSDGNEIACQDIGTTWLEDSSLRKSDGTDLMVLLSVEQYTFGQGALAIISALDITEQKKSEEEFAYRHQKLEQLLTMKGNALNETVKELIESENMYRGIIQNMQDVFYRTDLWGNIIMISPSAREVFGIPNLEDVIGKNFAEQIYNRPDERREYQRWIEAKGKIQNFELHGKRANGTPITLLANSQHYYTSHGEIAGVEGVLKDISGRKKTEEALRESEGKYRSLIENSHDAIFLQFEGQFEHVNPKFEQLFGIELEAIRSKEFNFMKLVDSGSKRFVKHLLGQQQIGTEPETRYEFTALDKDRNPIDVEIAVSHIPYKDAFAVLGVLRDITERKRSERKLRKISERLSIATEAAGIGVWEIDLEKKKLYWDIQMYILHQCDPEEYGTAFEAMLSQIHDDDIERTFAKLDRALAFDDRLELEYRVRTKQDAIFYLKVFAKISRDVSRKAVRITGVAYDISEAKTFQNALQNAETRYRTVADFTFDWETWYSATGDLLYCSPSCKRITGFTREDFLAQPQLLVRITHPGDKGLVTAHLNTIQQKDTDTRYSIEFRIISKDKKDVWIGQDVQQVFDAKGNYLGIRCSSRDITNQKQVFSTLKVKTKQLAALNEISSELAGISTELEVNAFIFSKFLEFTNSYFAVYSIYNKGQFSIKGTSKLTPDVQKILSRLQRSLLGIRYILPRDYIPALKRQNYLVIDDIADVLAANLIGKQMATTVSSWLGDGAIYFFPILQQNELKGVYTLFLNKGEAISGSSVEIIEGVVNQASIVLQRLYANNRLLQSLKEWQSFIANANTPIIGVEKQGRINEWNTSAEKLTGYSKQAVLGKYLEDELVAPDHRHKVSEIFQAAIHAKETPNFELPIISSTQNKIMLLMNVTHRKNEQGEIVGAIAVGQDITEIDFLRTELQHERASLARRVQERTAELSLANTQLAKAARLKDEFLASMSHELRTPLNAILGLTESMQEGIYGKLNDKQIVKLSDVEASGRHLLSLINEILDLAKIEAGKITLEYSEVNIKELVMASLRFVKQTAFKKKIAIEQDINCDAISFQADEKRIKQVLVNLLSNAVKFTPEGKELGLTVTMHTPDIIHFQIWDHGIGIAEESFSKLFQPFEQIDSKLSRKYEGTGLGLALVKKLVELHNGSVLVNSKVGHGSTFTIQLPFCSAKKTEATIDLPSNIVTTVSSNKNQKTVLLVEDNEINITTITEYLTAKNYKVELAVNGVDAIQKAQTLRPDIILMDIQMPKMDGLEATRRIRALPEKEVAQLPIFALTALAMPGDKERCLEAGANQYLQKPVSLKMLNQLIGQTINH